MSSVRTMQVKRIEHRADKIVAYMLRVRSTNMLYKAQVPFSIFFGCVIIRLNFDRNVAVWTPAPPITLVIAMTDSFRRTDVGHEPTRQLSWFPSQFWP